LQTKAALGGPEGDAYYDDVKDRLDRKHYATLQPGWWAVMRDPTAGTAYLLLSLMQPDHPEMTATDVLTLVADEPEQVERALSVVAPGFFRQAGIDARFPADAIEQMVDLVQSIVAQAFAKPRSSTSSNGPTDS
jgi:hypothetical protein